MLTFLQGRPPRCQGRRPNDLFPPTLHLDPLSPGISVGSRLWGAWLRRCLANHERAGTPQRGCAPSPATPRPVAEPSKRQEERTAGGRAISSSPAEKTRERILTFGHRTFSPLPVEGRLDSDVIMFSKKPFLAAPTPKAGLLLLCVPITPRWKVLPVWASYKDAVCSRTLATHLGLGFLTRTSWGRVAEEGHSCGR